MHFFYISVQWGRSLNTAALQSLRQQAKNPPIGSIGVTATALKILLSFSRFARESHGWLRKGNDNVLRCPCVGDPRCARMTEEKATLPRPHSLLSFRGVLVIEESHGWFHLGNDDGSENIAVILALRAGIPRLVA